MDERSDRGMNNNVTVIGAGRMASALATVLFHKGFATTVEPDWRENEGLVKARSQRSPERGGIGSRGGYRCC